MSFFEKITEMLTDEQKIRLGLWMEFEDDAEKVFKFILGETTIAQSIDQGQGHRKFIPDGVYYVFSNGSYTLYSENQEGNPVDCVGIGLKQGEHTFMIALNDVAGDEEVRLTSKEDKTSGFTYKPRECDALYDWDGESNTEHLKLIGLNPDIKLNDGEYIPSLAQLVAIGHNINAINSALSKIPFATQIAETGGWSSTEYSATGAWYLGFGSGGANLGAKASGSYRVRAVSAFNI